MHGDETVTTFKCKNCDFVSCDEDARFCPQCGQELEKIPDSEAGAGTCAPCPKCGSTKNAPSSAFCIDCGAPLGASRPQVAKNIACPACGFDKNAPDAKFCHQCGAAIGKESKAAVIGKESKAAVSVPKQTSVTQVNRVVNGPKLKVIPIARLFDKSTKDGISGKIMLATDGILFVSNQIGQVSFHIEDIASAKAGEKSNLLEVILKSGETKTFKFAGAKAWVPLINSLLAKLK